MIRDFVKVYKFCLVDYSSYFKFLDIFINVDS